MSPATTLEPTPLPQLDPPQAVAVIIGFIRAQLEQTGFERLVVGLSGGVDSATVAFLAARAVGPDNLLAVRMPYRTSDPSSETDALRVIDALGCDTQRVDITPMAEPMLALIGDGEETATRVRRGNVLARLRMIVLYDRSAAFDGLVCGTSNKTEILLGYTTLHGDMAAALQPIGDLYKSQLRAVATELGVPAEVIAKPSSADLWPGQTDEEELGATLRRPGPDPVRRGRPALDGGPMRARRPRRGARPLGGRARGPQRVQAADGAGGQGQPPHAGDRPPVPASPARLAATPPQPRRLSRASDGGPAGGGGHAHRQPG